MKTVKKNLYEMLFWHKSISQDLASLKRKLQKTLHMIEDMELPDMEQKQRQELSDNGQCHETEFKQMADNRPENIGDFMNDNM